MSQQERTKVRWSFSEFRKREKQSGSRRESRRREKKYAKTAEKKRIERERVIYQISRKESNSKEKEGKRVRQWEREALTFGVCF